MDDITIENLTSSDSDTDLDLPKNGIERKPIFSQNSSHASIKYVSLRSSLTENGQDSPTNSQEKQPADGIERKPISSQEPNLGNTLKCITSCQRLVERENDPPKSSFGTLGFSNSGEADLEHCADMLKTEHSHIVHNTVHSDSLFEPNADVSGVTLNSSPLCAPLEQPDESEKSEFCNAQRLISLSKIVPEMRSNSLFKQSTASSQSKKPEDSVKLLEPINFGSQEANRKMRSYSPITKEELAVNKPKVQLLESWMKSALLSTKKPNILLLSGPTGCGKTTTVHAIAASLNVRVIEWITPMDEFHDVNVSRFPTSNQSAKFMDFLLAGSRYQPVIGPSNTKKIIIVEDYPNAFLRTPSTFHDAVTKYCQQGKCPLIFITTDGRRKISLDLFPDKLLKAASIDQISFNPVAVTFMMKALDRIAMLQNRGYVDVDARKAICAAANGDLRSAENIWNFRFDGTTTAAGLLRMAVPKSRSRGRGRGGKREPVALSKKQGMAQIDSKDPGYEKLHCVGRVLYAKRESAPVESGSRDTDPRGYLRTNPDLMVGQFLSESRSFIALVHENYLALFSNIECVAQAAEYLSLSDVIAPDHRMDLENLQEMSFSIAIRGFMTSCTNPITKWNPLKKSRLREVADATQQFRQTVWDRYAGSPYSLTTAMVDMVPMLGNLERQHPYDKSDTGRQASPIPHISDSSDEDVEMH